MAGIILLPVSESSRQCDRKWHFSVDYVMTLCRCNLLLKSGGPCATHQPRPHAQPAAGSGLKPFLA
jgi:hypothetical protein